MFKISKTRLVLGISFLATAILLSSVSYFAVAKNEKSLTINFNDEVSLFAKLSTRAVVQNYELYFDSGYFKFSEVASDILGQNESIEKLDIIDTDGHVVYSSDKSSAASVKQESSKEIVNGTTLDAVKSLDTTKLYDTRGVTNLIIYPYVEDWGAHKYSVRYTISPQKLTHEFDLFRNEIIMAGVLLFTIIFFPLFSILYYRELSLSKGEKIKLESLNKQKDDFMTLVAHNLRTPISIMKGYTNLAEEQTLKGIEKEYIEAIKNGADRINEATETILSVTSLLSGESIKKEKVNITKITEETLNSSSVKIKEKKLKINFDKDNVVEANGSMKYLRKAIECYVDNAIKFNREKGSIDIIIEKSGGSINFKVKDTGIGIKEEDIGEIFSSFHRSVEDVLDYDYAGLGMGLYLTKTIIEAHKGTVSAKSEYGRGSTFGFSLPM